MKIRNDFVTNSSSSSFIVAFKSDDEMFETVEKELHLYSDEVKDTLVSDLRASAHYGGRKDIEYELDSSYSYRENTALREIVKKEIEDSIEGKDFVAVINYSDSTDLEGLLQYDILPEFSGTVMQFNHH